MIYLQQEMDLEKEKLVGVTHLEKEVLVVADVRVYGIQEDEECLCFGIVILSYGGGAAVTSASDAQCLEPGGGGGRRL
ncbi:hypothetical protein Tco_1201504 [Tanacetum coccineum]